MQYRCLLYSLPYRGNCKKKIIEKKTGKKITFGKVKQMGSGDDSVLIDRGRIRTIEEVDKKIEELIK